MRTIILWTLAVLGTLAFAGTAQGSRQFALLDKDPRTPDDNLRPSAVTLGDVDGDGDLDAIVTEPYRLLLFRNDGEARFAEVPAAFAAPSDTLFMVALGDVDGDGDLDVVLSTDKRARLYLNDGTGRFTDVTATHLPVDTDFTYRLALGDLDGDGDLDLVLGGGRCNSCPPPRNRVYRNDGSGRFIDVPWSLPPDPDPVGAMTLGDVDGDGDIDLVFGGVGQDRLYLNDGTGVFANATARWMPVDLRWTGCLVLGDADNDGDLDLALAGGSNYEQAPVRLYLNDGTAFRDVTATHMNGITAGCTGLALVDLDRDGDLDLALASFGAFFYGRLAHVTVHRNDGTGRFAAASAAGLGGTLDTRIDVWAFAAGDLDGDGDPDLLTGNLGAPLRVLLGAGGGRLLDVLTRLPLYYAGDITAFDADGDGFPEYVSCGLSAGCLLARNDGQGIFRLTAAAWPDTRGALRAAAGDVDGDGDLDLLFAARVVGARAGINELHLNDGRGGFVRGTGAPADRDHTKAVALADVDGDGDLDFVAANFEQPTWLYLNDGNANFTRSLGLTTGAGTATDVAFGDVDGDSDADLLLAVHDGQSRLFLNDARGGFTEATASRLPIGTLAAQALLLLDVDRDGDLDAVLGGDRNRLWLNDGRGFFTDVTATHLPGVGGWTWRLAAGDFDQDGALDLALATVEDPRRPTVFRLFHNDGTGRFAEVPGGIPPVDDFNQLLAFLDIDDDGDSDLIAGHSLFVNLHRQLHSRELARPGRVLPIDVYAKPGYATGFQLVAPFAGTVRLPTPRELPPLGRLRIDPAQAFPLPPLVIPPPGGAARLDLALPNLAVLRGHDLLVQAVMLHTAQPGDARLTGLLFEPIH